MGLDHLTYGGLRTQILNTAPLPSTNRVFAMLTNEETHKNIVSSHDVSSNALGYATHIPVAPKEPTDLSKPRDTCTHCGKAYHHVSKCYQLFGYPTRSPDRGCGRGRSSSGRSSSAISANAIGPLPPYPVGSSSASTLADFSPEIIQRVLNLAESSNPAPDQLTGKAFHSSSWLIDSGASQHMTGNLAFLSHIQDISPCFVGLPNGNCTKASQMGTVFLTPSFTLTHVLYVPSLACNLISISKLIRKDACLVFFVNRLCLVQDHLLSVSKIGVLETICVSD